MQEKKLEMYGGLFGGLIPLIVLVGGLVWLSVAERGGTKPFWACAWIALCVGIFFAKNKEEYCKAAMRGIGDRTGSVIVTAWLLAGVFGKLMAAGGLVQGLLWMGMTTGAQGGVFVVLVFLAAMLFALGTGTSTGTCIALSPVLYPAGYFLGADPAMLGLAILSGAAFGDNLAPISDTTIVSAYTQGAEMRDVVHIIESLIYGNVAAAFVGMLIGTIRPADIFSVPAAKGGSTGLIQAGIDNVVGAIIFAILILAVTQILVECGIMRRILDFAQSTLVATVRQAELFIVGVTILASIPISANAPAELLVGPSIVRPLGERFGLAAARRANLMDCAVCTIFFVLPWHIAVAAWYGALYSAAETYAIPAPPISAALYNPYSWALLAVLLFSAFTGWNRKYAKDEAPAA